MDQCERSPIALTANKKKMVLSVHNYIHSLEIINLRKEVSLATGVGEATIARVLAEFNKTGAVIASKQGHRSSRTLKTDYIKAIQDLILTANKNGIPLSLRMLVLDLTELGFPKITSEVVVSCWKKCLNKAKEYWKTIEVGIGDESNEDSNTDTDEFDQL
ncbi:10706_t:CDS:2 [Gigaspora margarita]|uniref:10706_t:CDS:1 n=1 Tax=Gigaspora margarita TaxID=4874 RepID=A0ABN7VCV9_GIGMA|nr:10706_t:CDS:2 [Gigaspora margarita]